jgi:hypothetical protein
VDLVSNDNGSLNRDQLHRDRRLRRLQFHSTDRKRPQRLLNIYLTSTPSNATSAADGRWSSMLRTEMPWYIKLGTAILAIAIGGSCIIAILLALPIGLACDLRSWLRRGGERDYRSGCHSLGVWRRWL